MDLAELDRAYQQAMKGSAEPDYIVCPYGVIAKDGHVYEFDSEGRWYRVPPEDEEKLREAITDWMQRARDAGLTK